MNFGDRIFWLLCVSPHAHGHTRTCVHTGLVSINQDTNESVRTYIHTYPRLLPHGLAALDFLGVLRLLVRGRADELEGGRGDEVGGEGRAVGWVVDKCGGRVCVGMTWGLALPAWRGATYLMDMPELETIILTMRVSSCSLLLGVCGRWWRWRW